jgi:NYN domain/OST-HTH/LOTUS domain
MLRTAVELIQLFPPGPSAKNGADIKLCLDAVEDLARFHHIGTVIIIGGDSDFMPVAQKIKAAGRTLIGIGNRRNTNRHWAKSCHEFRYYDSLVEPKAPEGTAPAQAKGDLDATAPSDPAADVLRRAMHLLSESKGDPWIDKASIFPMIKRLDPTFDPKDHGHESFVAMLKALDTMVEVRKGQTDHELRLR